MSKKSDHTDNAKRKSQQAYSGKGLSALPKHEFQTLLAQAKAGKSATSSERPALGSELRPASSSELRAAISEELRPALSSELRPVTLMPNVEDIEISIPVSQPTDFTPQTPSFVTKQAPDIDKIDVISLQQPMAGGPTGSEVSGVPGPKKPKDGTRPESLNGAQGRAPVSLGKVGVSVVSEDELMKSERQSQPVVLYGGDRIVLNRVEIVRQFQEKAVKKRCKYKKILESVFKKISQITSYFLKRKPEFNGCESLQYIIETFLQNDKYTEIIEQLNVRKIQLFTKMYLYWISEYQKELKERWNLKIIKVCDKLIHSVKRVLLYRDNTQAQLNVPPDSILSKSQIYDAEESNLTSEIKTEGNIDLDMDTSQCNSKSSNNLSLKGQLINYEKEMKGFRRRLEKDKKLTSKIQITKDGVQLPKLKSSQNLSLQQQDASQGGPNGLRVSVSYGNKLTDAAWDQTARNTAAKETYSEQLGHDYSGAQLPPETQNLFFNPNAGPNLFAPGKPVKQEEQSLGSEAQNAGKGSVTTQAGGQDGAEGATKGGASTGLDGENKDLGTKIKFSSFRTSDEQGYQISIFCASAKTGAPEGSGKEVAGDSAKASALGQTADSGEQQGQPLLQQKQEQQVGAEGAKEEEGQVVVKKRKVRRTKLQKRGVTSGSEVPLEQQELVGVAPEKTGKSYKKRASYE